MNDVKKLYENWLENCTEKDLRDELVNIQGNDDEILDRFYRYLDFGTAGLRGVLGAGTNRMNIYTVCHATQGLCNYLNAHFDNPSVAIGYDSRLKSDAFARESACVFAANGIKVFLFPHLVPTPFVSYAVMQLHCSSGVVITASHNPSKYNGYKCYGDDGYQITDEAAAETYEYIGKVDMFGGVKKMSFDSAVSDGIVEYIGNDLIEAFYKTALEKSINPEICASSDLRVVYTPLNGTGNIPVRTVLKRIGFKNIRVVPEQELPDGNFPTCPYPNPEIRQAFECALKMAENEKEKPDLLLATDPDSDRLGIAVLHNGEYVLMSGNNVGVLFTQYILKAKKENGTLPEAPVMTESIVSTPLLEIVANACGAEVKQLLTGFKYVGEYIAELEKEGKDGNFLMGMEESYGYLVGTHVRDKDAVAASLLMCEMAAYYKKKGKTLVDVMNDIYDEFGYFSDKLYNFGFEGASGMKKMADIMASTRQTPPTEIAGLPVVKISDYLQSLTTDTVTGETKAIDQPKSNVLSYALPDGCRAVVRPSGTEPKIKVYITARGENPALANELADKIGEGMKKMLKIES